MVMDSLRYWVESCHVDGFRFDLASSLGRDRDTFNTNAIFLDAVRQDPVLSRVKMIAEPWDTGPEGYQLGNFPPGWAEWNDQYRDTVRSYWKGDSGTTPDLAARLLGSAEFFDARGRRPWASVNFVTAHDGFTLKDTVTYNDKHNEANKEDNRDGHSDNRSWNCGVEGPTDDAEVLDLRDRMRRAMMATLLLSQGTPMVLMGDEVGRTQDGNNNTYCQDTEANWLNLDGLDERDERFLAFVRAVIAIRRSHPLFRLASFVHAGSDGAKGVEVAWLQPSGAAMAESDWHNPESRTLGLLLSNEESRVLMIFNSHYEPVAFTLPEGDWGLLIDSAEGIVNRISRGAARRERRLRGSGALPARARGAALTARRALTWGAHLGPEGARFRIWAPAQQTVRLRLGDRDHPMRRDDEGWFETTVAGAAAGAAYGFVLDDGRMVPDPASRAQTGDVHGPSRLVDASAFRWQHSDWRSRPWAEAVIYELHVGAFTPEGTFRAAVKKLEHLASLGISAIEIMPVAHFDGEHGWGYDGVLPYAPHPAYGAPDDLKALVDAAHGAGLMVLLDVVYNHFGPEGNYLGAYATDFFHPERHTPWGSAIAYERGPVRRFFIENALFWLEEFRFDGLRLDAVDHIRDEESDVEILVELAQEVRAAFPDRRIHLTTEDNRNITRLHERAADGTVPLYTAEWNDDLHNVAHVIATGETEGYYEDFTEDHWAKYARALAEGFAYQGEPSRHAGGEPRGAASTHLPPTAFVDFLQNHDQIGNRAFGERLIAMAPRDLVRAMTAILLLSPHVPLMFMGEEWGETRPFAFFTDFHGELAAAVREGRRREFRHFPAFEDKAMRERIPDPNAAGTFAASKIDWSESETAEGREWMAFVSRLLDVRRREVVPHLADAGGHCGRVVTADDGVIAVDWRLAGADLRLRANLSDTEAAAPPAAGRAIFATPGAESGETLPPASVRIVLDTTA